MKTGDLHFQSLFTVLNIRGVFVNVHLKCYFTPTFYMISPFDPNPILPFYSTDSETKDCKDTFLSLTDPTERRFAPQLKLKKKTAHQSLYLGFIFKDKPARCRYLPGCQGNIMIFHVTPSQENHYCRGQRSYLFSIDTKICSTVSSAFFSLKLIMVTIIIAFYSDQSDLNASCQHTRLNIYVRLRVPNHSAFLICTLTQQRQNNSSASSFTSHFFPFLGECYFCMQVCACVKEGCVSMRGRICVSKTTLCLCLPVAGEEGWAASTAQDCHLWGLTNSHDGDPASGSLTVTSRQPLSFLVNLLSGNSGSSCTVIFLGGIVIAAFCSSVFDEDNTDLFELISHHSR